MNHVPMGVVLKGRPEQREHQLHGDQGDPEAAASSRPMTDDAKNPSPIGAGMPTTTVRTKRCSATASRRRGRGGYLLKIHHAPSLPWLRAAGSLRPWYDDGTMTYAVRTDPRCVPCWLQEVKDTSDVDGSSDADSGASCGTTSIR